MSPITGHGSTVTSDLSPSDGLDPVSLFHSARDHADAAVALSQLSPSYLDSAGYLAHLSIELALKAWLLYIEGKVARTHDLKKLFSRLKYLGCVTTENPSVCCLLETLNSYYHLRYPNLIQPTEVGGDDLANLKGLLNYLHDQFPEGLKNDILSLNELRKGGRVLMRKAIQQMSPSGEL